MKKNLILACVSIILLFVGTALGQSHAYLWDAINGARDLGSLGGDSYAYAINDSGTVVGYYIPLDKFYAHGFIWTEASGMVALGIPGGGDSTRESCVPTAINSAGNVVGYARQADGAQVAFFWSPTGGFTTIGDLSSNADNGNTAYAINDRDQVTGNFLIKQQTLVYHAYIWTPDRAHPRDLGVIDGEQFSLGNGINNLGQIVGGSLSTSDFQWQPMTWKRQAGMSFLGMISGTLYAQARAINDAGQIIGIDQTGTADLSFYTDPHTGLKFLKGLGGNSTYADAINQQGVIVGGASDTTQSQRAVMWATPSSAPEVLPLAGAYGLNNVGQVVGYAAAQ